MPPSPSPPPSPPSPPPFTPVISGDVRVVKSGDTCEESGFATITSPVLCGRAYEMAKKDKLFLESVSWGAPSLDGKFKIPNKNFQGCNRITHPRRIFWRTFNINSVAFHEVVDGALKEPCSDVRATSQLPAPSPPPQLSLSLALFLASVSTYRAEQSPHPYMSHRNMSTCTCACTCTCPWHVHMSMQHVHVTCACACCHVCTSCACGTQAPALYGIVRLHCSIYRRFSML